MTVPKETRLRKAIFTRGRSRSFSSAIFALAVLISPHAILASLAYTIAFRPTTEHDLQGTSLLYTRPSLRVVDGLLHRPPIEWTDIPIFSL